MSNTLEETNQYDVPKWLIEALKSYDGMMFASQTKGEKMRAKRKLNEAIVRRAHRIGMEAIGENFPSVAEADQHDVHINVTIKWLNIEKEQQRERLYKITGVKE